MAGGWREGALVDCPVSGARFIQSFSFCATRWLTVFFHADMHPAICSSGLMPGRIVPPSISAFNHGADG